MPPSRKPEDLSREDIEVSAEVPLPTRRDALKAGAGVVLVVSGIASSTDEARAASLKISNRYSPRDKRRPQRPSTRYIVLHMTEGGEKGSLRKIRRRGEAHYFVTRSGRVYRIIEKSKIATHAGRSMWDGRKVVDNHSIGIEVVGFHNKEPTKAQYEALKELLRQLKSLYRISDDNVVTHSMVAYGSPNKFHPNNHRGRKRCAMIFARYDVREKLGLYSKPARDKDVEAGRLRVGDWELHRFLYAKSPASRRRPVGDTEVQQPTESNVISREWSAWDIAREHYDSSETLYVFPNGRRFSGSEITDWSRIPVGTRVELPGETVDEKQGFDGFREVGTDGRAASEVAGEAFDEKTTIYFFPNGMVRTGHEVKRRKSTRALLNRLPKGTRVLVGYVYGGHVKKSRLPARIAGVKWNYPSTYYRLPDGRILSGDEIDDSAIPLKTLIFYEG